MEAEGHGPDTYVLEDDPEETEKATEMTNALFRMLAKISND